MTSRQLDEERIFHVARDIATRDSRDEYLDQICAGDRDLRKRVEALLEVHEEEESFLKSADPPVIETIELGNAIERPGASIGRYKLMEQIGEGGMGTVFVARQERPIRRKVALKVVKPGMDSKAVIARFEAERQALAVMDHPNIAKVLDAGATDRGRPYFVMELVSGIPITDYCDEHKLMIRERLSLFATVCQAIQHAHQKGIIHRDIKPSNVLVTEQDGKAIPKVIDFGVAKAIGQSLTDRTVYTSFQSVVGTPLYMSPEQAALSNVDVDTRSDVYSLGVLLYELLTGTTPFDRELLGKAGQDEVLRIIREHEPVKPSTKISTLGERGRTVSQGRRTDMVGLGKAVRGDLDWIVMKALDKDRTRRYETANGFASDVEAFLANEAVEARPPSTWYQLEKVFQRNKVLVATVLTVFLALLGGLGVALWGLKQARSERDRFEALLRDYEPLVLNEIFDNVFSGDNEAASQAIDDAEIVGVTTEKLAALRGIQQIFSGKQKSYKQGIATFERMLKTNENNVIALSMLVWAQVAGYGDLDIFAAAGQRHRNLDPRDDFEKVVWAAGLSVEGNFRGLSSDGEGLQIAKETLEDVVRRNPSWKLPRLLLARVLSDYAIDSGEARYVSEAIDVQLRQLDTANPALVRSPFWLSQRLHVYNVGSRLLASDEKANCRAEADRLAESLIAPGHDDYILGRLERALYFTNAAEMDGATDFSKAITEWRIFHKHSENDLYGSLFGGLLIRTGLIAGDMTEADEYYEAHPLPFSAYFDGDRIKSLSLCGRLDSEEKLLSKFWTYATMFACGHDSRDAAIAYFKRLKAADDYPPWIELPLHLFLDETTPDQVKPSESRVHRAWAFQVTGNYLVNVGRDKDAETYFDKVIESDSFMMDVHQWAHAFRLRIENDPDWFQRMNPATLP